MRSLRRASQSYFLHKRLFFYYLSQGGEKKHDLSQNDFYVQKKTAQLYLERVGRLISRYESILTVVEQKGFLPAVSPSPQGFDEDERPSINTLLEGWHLTVHPN